VSAPKIASLIANVGDDRITRILDFGPCSALEWHDRFLFIVIGASGWRNTF